MSFEQATVYVIGVGPGETDLLTLRAARTLERCDVIFHAGPRDDVGFALGVVAPLLRPLSGRSRCRTCDAPRP